jgi:hypothetical protein
MFLIDDRPSQPDRRPWEPNWHVVSWLVAVVVVGYASTVADGVLSAALLTAAFAAVCRALAVAIPYGGGLTEWKQ